MAKYCSSAVLDASLDYIKQNVKKMGLYESAPANLAACTAATALAIVAMTSDDFTIGDSSVSGRKIDVSAKTTVAVMTTGVGTYCALFSSAAGSSGFHYMTSCSTQVCGSTLNTIDFPTWIIRFADPT